MKEETAERIISHIKHIITEKQIKSLQIEWFGGEPFLQYEQNIKFIGTLAKKICKEHNIEFTQSATTNGYFLSKTIVEELEESHFNMFQITLDGNKGHHDKVKIDRNCDSTFNKVLNNIKNILTYTSKIFITLRINYDYTNVTDELLHQINNFIPKELRHRIIVFPHKIWQTTFDPEKHTDLQSIWRKFKIAGCQVTDPIFYGRFESCYANRKNYTKINYNGDVLKCASDGNFIMPDGLRPGEIDCSGKIAWKDGMHDKYTTPTGRTLICSKCRYLPLCMGNCPKESIKGHNTCKFKNKEFIFRKAIINYIQIQNL